MVAASDYPMEFRTKAHKISPTLFSGDKFKKQIPKASPHETEEETTTVADQTLNASILIKEEGHGNPNPPMGKQTVGNWKQQRPMIVRIKLNKSETNFQIPKGPEKKVNDDGVAVFYCDQGVAEVMRMKAILEKSESEWEVLDLLTKLDSMGLSVKSLEATKIGITVSCLRKHASENVRKMALTMVKFWKDMVNQWIKKQSSVVDQTKPTKEKKLEGFIKAPKTGNGGVMNSFDKVEATKRKQSTTENVIKSLRGKACPTEIQKGPVTPEKKIDDHGARVYDDQEVVAEVLRIKKMLDYSGDEVEVCDLLTKLQCMGLSYKTLEATVIGKPVTALKKHPSKNVCEIAGTLVKAWKRTADEWIEKEANETSQQSMPLNLNIMKMERKLEGSEKNAKIGAMDSSEKLEATKRKLQQGYEKAENLKKKRRVQLLELHEVAKQGLLPKKIPRNNHNRKNVYWR